MTNHGGPRPKTHANDKRGGPRPGSGPKPVWLKMRIGQRVTVVRHLNMAGVEPHCEEWKLVRNDDNELEFRTPREYIILGRPLAGKTAKE